MGTRSTWAPPEFSKGPIPRETPKIHCRLSSAFMVPSIVYTQKSRVTFKNRFVSFQRSLRLQAVLEAPGAGKGGQMVQRVCGSYWKIMPGLRQMVIVFTTTKSWKTSKRSKGNPGLW